MRQNVIQQVKKYNNIVQPNRKQRNTTQGNNSCIQEYHRMTPTATLQPVGFLIKFMLCTTRLTLRLDMGAVFQWNGCYWTTNPPSMYSLIVGSSKNIRRIGQYMYIHCKARVTRTNLVGELPGYGTVWFHPDGIANILSLARVKTKYQITFDSDENNEFIVHKQDGSTRNFKESCRGLYYHDTSTVVTQVAETGMVLVTTVADNASNYTHADYSCALLACKTQQIIG